MKVVILPNIRSQYNVGAIFRTADAMGVNKIYLTGFTPTPLDRFGRPAEKIAKTALGAEKTIDWEYQADVLAVIKQLQNDVISVVAVEQDERSVELEKFKVPEKVAYIFGSETEGLAKEILAVVDSVVEIPMLGQKESLNVSVTAGIVLYHR